MSAQQVLILAASRGIGHELACQYVARGARVTATARTPADIEALEQMGAQAFDLDVTDPTRVGALSWRLEGSSFDTVFLCAGLMGPRHAGLDAPDRQDFDAVMHTNVLSAMWILPQLTEVLGPQARVGVLSSQMGSIGSRQTAQCWLYRASKAALNSVVKDAALTWAGRMICVALHPGWVRTDMGGPKADLSPQQSARDLISTLERLGVQDSGGFFNHDAKPIPW